MEPVRTEGQEAPRGRRRFLKWTLGALGALNGLILGIPFIKTLLASPPVEKNPFEKVTDLQNLPVGQPLDMHFDVAEKKAYYHEVVEHRVWVIKHPEGVTTFSPICPHMGCYYKWDPKTGHFECPCHGSVYAKDGRVLAGPAPRPLDTMPHKIENHTLLVEWVRYKVGIPKKVPV